MFFLIVMVFLSRCSSAAPLSYVKPTIPTLAALRDAPMARSLHHPRMFTKEKLPSRPEVTSFPRDPCGWRGAHHLLVRPNFTMVDYEDCAIKKWGVWNANVPYLLPEAISPSLNLNLVFVAGCVVAVVAMVCGMMVYKSRGSKVNYKLVKSDEIWSEQFKLWMLATS